jgi:hypothetical protein
MRASKGSRKASEPSRTISGNDLLSQMSELISLRERVMQAELHAEVSLARTRARDRLGDGERPGSDRT